MVTITITRSQIYAIAEGISIKISQHNGGTPTFEQLWASEAESRKLDIYYREAISELEHRLVKWVSAVSGQFNLAADGTDYTIRLSMPQYWPTRLEGLLANEIQNYLVHAITAGWLGDFEGVTPKQDYASLTSVDLLSIRDIIYQRSFSFAEASREDDTEHKDTSNEPTAAARKQDEGKDAFVLPREAGFRKKDNVVKEGPDDKPFICRERTDRHEDNVAVMPHEDWTDMSGTGVAYRERMCKIPTRPMKGRGFTPQPDHKPIDGVVCPKPCSQPPYLKNDPHSEPKVYPEPPYHAIPPTYPPEPPLPEVHANGVDWSDADTYPQEKEQKFVESHECGHHDCEGGMFDFVPDDTDDDEENNEQ